MVMRELSRKKIVFYGIAEGPKQPETFRTFELSRLYRLSRRTGSLAHGGSACVIRVVPIGDGQAARASSVAGRH